MAGEAASALRTLPTNVSSRTAASFSGEPGFSECWVQFLTLARVFEDLGVSAYAGAAGLPFVASSPYIGAAARILAAEAEHVGNIRLQIARLNISTAALDAVDIIPPPSGQKFISVDATTGLCAVRTPGQVLYLAYGNAANAVSGAFFPAGVNGTINTSCTSA